MSDKFGDECDFYFYLVLNVLCNCFGICQVKNLQQVVFEMIVLWVVILLLGLWVCGLFYLCVIYYQLYQDLFDWVGCLCEVNFYLGDMLFCYFVWIEEEGNVLMQVFEQEDYFSGLLCDIFIECLSWFYGEINVLYFFCFGNGLIQCIFFEQLVIYVGYFFNWCDVDFVGWSVVCQQSVMGDLVLLVVIFCKVVSEVWEFEQNSLVLIVLELL